MTGGPELGGRPGPTAPPDLVEHFFRHEYGRLVALLTRKAGVRHMELVEDAVRCALTASRPSPASRRPPLGRTAAYNTLVGDLRRDADRLRILERAVDAVAVSRDDPAPSYFAGEVRDDVLRMLFVCCHDTIPRASRLVLALKTLCGLSTAAIALRLFTSEANVHKRLARASDKLREAPPDTQTPPPETPQSRLPSVHAVLYLLFEEEIPWQTTYRSGS